MNYWKLGCRWGSKSEGKPLFYDLLIKYNIVIGWEDKDYDKGAYVLLTDGHSALGIAKTLSSRKSVLDFPEYEDELIDLEIDYSENLYVYEACIFTLADAERFNFETQVGICRINKHDIQKKIDNVFSNVNQKLMEVTQKKNCINILKYKKQIILQGPPGTGKTKLAKEIAEELITVNKETLLNKIQVGLSIGSVKGEVSYLVKAIDEENEKITIEREKGSINVITFKKVIDCFYQKRWLIDSVGNDERMAAAVAKYFYDNYLTDHSQYKIMQFHPSFSYEDFVRGIQAESNGNSIEYKNVNRVLGLFAKEAQQNYLDSKKTQEEIKVKISFEDKFRVFKQKVEESIAKNGFYQIGDTEASIFDITDENFIYSFKNNSTQKNNLLFADLEKLNQLNPKVNTTKEVFDLTPQLKNKGKQTYYFKIFTAIKELAIPSSLKEVNLVTEKKYVLIIDEINRANLSSVLGELIYALEYRGENVESMYDVDGSNKLVLPPNLYIIGTMNTADRSVGYIDYAIRRRFAFVDVLPEDLDGLKDIVFYSDLFEAVSKLFIENYEEYKNDRTLKLKHANTLSSEFRPEDVWLGHSYFIEKKDATKRMRLQYEILPILKEYVKDGVLIGNAIDLINDLDKLAG